MSSEYTIDANQDATESGFRHIIVQTAVPHLIGGLVVSGSAGGTWVLGSGEAFVGGRNHVLGSSHTITKNAGVVNYVFLDYDGTIRAETSKTYTSGYLHSLFIAQFDDGGAGNAVSNAYEYGYLSSGYIKADSIGTAEIIDASITSPKISDHALTSSKYDSGSIFTFAIADYAVDSGKMASGAITTFAIADGAVDSGKIAADAVQTGNINDEAVTTAKIGSYAVTGAKIQSGAIDDNVVASGDISHNRLKSIDGGGTNEYYHLSQADYNDLTGGGDTTLHYHNSDRGGAFAYWNFGQVSDTNNTTTYADYNAPDESFRTFLIDGSIPDNKQKFGKITIYGRADAADGAINVILYDLESSTTVTNSLTTKYGTSYGITTGGEFSIASGRSTRFKVQFRRQPSAGGTTVTLAGVTLTMYTKD